MKNLHVGLVAMAMMAANGCAPGTPGGPGVPSKPATPATPATPTTPAMPATPATPAEKPVFGEAEETFNLSVPALSTHLKQGETKVASISLARGKNFDEDVTLEFDDLPKGVTIDPASHVIKHGDTEAKFTFQATDDAALGDFTVKVTGHPTKGADAKTEFKLTVDEK
jgi:hypothetical protein